MDNFTKDSLLVIVVIIVFLRNKNLTVSPCFQHIVQTRLPNIKAPHGLTLSSTSHLIFPHHPLLWLHRINYSPPGVTGIFMPPCLCSYCFICLECPSCPGLPLLVLQVSEQVMVMMTANN